MSNYTKIKNNLKAIEEAKMYLNKRKDMIMGNTAYIDHEMIRKDESETEKSIENVKNMNLELLPPELAALRKQERDGDITTEERREAVKAYYNKKTGESR